MGIWISSTREGRMRSTLLALGVAGNLGALGYFKYARFLAESLGALVSSSGDVGDIVLPLAISFFTFQQIAFLVDTFQGKARECKFLHYCLFVTFFPQLIAGPIVHHREMLPQFQHAGTGRVRTLDLAVGITIFSIGLFKKTVLADGVAVYATPVFLRAEAGEALDFLEAWGGALAYTFQLYFDFSGYSDMAIGAARMFGIRLPMNFYSPYKALSIVDFWRRWHMTLSRFLRNYLYIPLGGNRGGLLRRYANLWITMLLGGLWHGAGWTFVAWGAMHGSYLMINHGWRALCAHLGWELELSRAWRVLAWLLTFCAVVFAWVPFRAPTFSGATEMLRGMIGLNGVALPAGILIRLGSAGTLLQSWGMETLHGGGVQLLATYGWVICLLAISLLAPSTQELMRKYRPCFDFYGHFARASAGALRWRPVAPWGLAIASIGVVAMLGLAQVSEFLYFQF